MIWVVVPMEGMVGGNFDRRGPEFVRWAKRALPEDPEIRALPEPKPR